MHMQPGSRFAKRSLFAVVSSIVLTSATPLLAQDDDDGSLDEIVVYSSKRGIVNLQDIPTSIGILTAEDMARMGTLNFDDISRAIVGLDVVNQGPGNNTVVIRGIHAEGESGATVVWDNMPTSGAGESASEIGQRQFDLDVYDVQQVEVLRGPQGTLYGANSLTGVVHFITNKPVMNEVSASLEGSYSDVAHSEEAGWSQRGFINIPIMEDTVAFRLAAWHRYEPGFIDAVSLTPTTPPVCGPFFCPIPIPEIGVNAIDINDYTRSGYRASLAINMGDNSDLLFQYIGQTTESHGGPNDRPMFTPVAYIGFEPSGDYKTLKTAHDTADEDLTMMGVTLNHTFDGLGTATFSSSYASKRTDITTDFTGLLYIGRTVIELPRAVGNFPDCLAPDSQEAVDNFLNYADICYPGAGDGALGMAHVQDTEMDLWTTEFRFASELDGPINYIAGVTGQRRTIDFYGAFLETDPNSGYIYEVTEENTRMFEREADFVMTSWAIYGELSWAFTDSLTLTVGGRTFGTHKDQGGILYGNMFEQPGILNPGPGEVLDKQYPVADEGRSMYDENATIFKGELTYRATDNFMMYGTVGQGYRPGGAINQVLDIMPESFEHDETLNYEIGAKTTWWDNRITLNLAFYQIDFEDMQYRAPYQNDAFDAQLNCSGKCAESKGGEFELTIAATENLTFYLNAGHTKNEILQNLYRPYEDDTLGYAALAGDPLSTQTPEDTMAAGIQYAFQVGNMDGFARIDYTETGSMERLNNDRSSDDPRPADHPDGEYSGTIADSELENEIEVPGWHAVHARIGLQGESFGVELYARNLTDEIAAIHQSSNGVFLGDRTLAQPRTIGIQFKWNYN